jgi:hypothetical protein
MHAHTQHTIRGIKIIFNNVISLDEHKSLLNVLLNLKHACLTSGFKSMLKESSLK